MEPNLRILYFEYILLKLIQWHKECSKSATNDISILKSLKLLFFVSAAKSSESHKSNLLEDVFMDFVAMPYGHVEGFVYNYIREKNGVLTYFTINNQGAELNDGARIEQLIADIKETVRIEIDESIKYLRIQNPHLILMPPFDLVNLSHAWYSWQEFYKKAIREKKGSYQIPPEVIKSEVKIFSLQNF